MGHLINQHGHNNTLEEDTHFNQYYIILSAAQLEISIAIEVAWLLIVETGDRCM